MLDALTLLALGSLAESLEPRITELATSSTPRELEIVVRNVFDARAGLCDAIDAARLENRLIEHARTFGAIGRALGRAELELLRHAETFADLVAALPLPQPGTPRAFSFARLQAVAHAAAETPSERLRRLELVAAIDRYAEEDAAGGPEDEAD